MPSVSIFQFRRTCDCLWQAKINTFNIQHFSSWINIVFQSSTQSFSNCIRGQSVRVLSTTVTAQNKPGKYRTKPCLCLLTSALPDNTFLVGQRGNIQTGSPQLFFRYLSNKIPFRRQAVCVCAQWGWGGCFKQTLNPEVIMPCQPDGLCSWQGIHSILYLGLVLAKGGLCRLVRGLSSKICQTVSHKIIVPKSFPYASGMNNGQWLIVHQSRNFD